MLQPPKHYAPDAGRGTRLREAACGDYEQIATLESRYGLATGSFERWRHIWLNNPEYRALQRCWTVGWVIEEERGQIVASIGNVPLSYELAGKRILAVSGRA